MSIAKTGTTGALAGPLSKQEAEVAAELLGAKPKKAVSRPRARAPRLRRADVNRSGITRRRVGEGFEYLDEAGNVLTDPDVVERVTALVLPPAWTDVWICRDPLGHIQAIGVDVAGRKQYRYHELWRQRRDREKFEKMHEFARALPGLREATAEHLATDGLNRERVLACAVRLLDLGFFRIGSEDYAEQNQTYGLATMQKRHVRLVDDSEVRFDYIAKSGKHRLQTVVDPDVFEVVRQLKNRRGGGKELLAYRHKPVGWVDVRSHDINAYIKDVTGGEFSAKDFRTWSATVLAAVALGVSSMAITSERARKRAITRMYQEVSTYLGNTPAVCKASYVDPRIVDRFVAGHTIADSLDLLGEESSFGQLSTRGPIEGAVLELLEDEPSTQLRQSA